MEEIVNRVANSGIITFNLEDYYQQGERVTYDIAQNLFQGLILREKDFRQFLKEKDWMEYDSKNVALHCSADAIVPTWAYMLLADKLFGIANKVVFGDLVYLENILITEAISKVEWESFEGKRVVVKGCGDLDIPESAYVEVMHKLRPYAKSIMYGEPCSTVPLYKRK